MTNDLIKFFLSLFNNLGSIRYGKEITIFIISLMPILELRGGLIAASLLKVNPISSYIISIIGNVLPVPIILMFFNSILNFFKKKKKLTKFINFVDKKVEKNKESIEKYGYLGLTLFVGVPLPGTGAWTGCLIASVLEMNKKKSFVAIFLGIIMASIIMMLLSFGILGRFV